MKVLFLSQQNRCERVGIHGHSQICNRVDGGLLYTLYIVLFSCGTTSKVQLELSFHTMPDISLNVSGEPPYTITMINLFLLWFNLRSSDRFFTFCGHPQDHFLLKKDQLWFHFNIICYNQQLLQANLLRDSHNNLNNPYIIQPIKNSGLPQLFRSCRRWDGALLHQRYASDTQYYF